MGVLQYLNSSDKPQAHVSSSPFLERPKKGSKKDLDNISFDSGGSPAVERDSNSGSGAAALRRLEREKQRKSQLDRLPQGKEYVAQMQARIRPLGGTVQNKNLKVEKASTEHFKREVPEFTNVRGVLKSTNLKKIAERQNEKGTAKKGVNFAL